MVERQEVVVRGSGVDLEALVFHQAAPAAEAAEPSAAVVLLHGWGGSAETMATPARQLATLGSLAVSVSMRGFGGSGGTDDCGLRQPDDVAEVARWIGSTHPRCASRVGLLGISQGGQVALLAAARCPAVSAVAAWSPVTDVAAWRRGGPPPSTRRSRATSTPPAPTAPAPTATSPGRSPTSFVTELAERRVAILLVHGDADTRVPTDQSRRLHDALVRHGGDARIELLAGVGHQRGPAGNRRAFDLTIQLLARLPGRQRQEDTMGSSSVQRELWGRQPQVWSQDLEPMLAPLYRATLDALDAVTPLAGRRLLDVGCGAGLALQMAASRGADVAGLDATPALLAVAADRVPAADLREGDLESLPHDDDTFDVVCAFNSIQYADDPAVAVAEIARVCRPGGTVALGMWGDPVRCESDALFARLRSLAPAAPGAAAPLQLSDPGVLEGLLESAGLQVEGAGEVACPFEFDNLDHAWTVHQSGGPMQKAIDLAGADTVRALLDEVLEADRKPDGALRQDNVFRYVTATAP